MDKIVADPPMAFVFTVFIQIAALVWHASAVNSRVNDLKLQITELKQRISAHDDTNLRKAERLTRIEALLEMLVKANKKRDIDD